MNVLTMGAKLIGAWLGRAAARELNDAGLQVLARARFLLHNPVKSHGGT